MEARRHRPPPPGSLPPGPPTHRHPHFFKESPGGKEPSPAPAWLRSTALRASGAPAGGRAAHHGPRFGLRLTPRIFSLAAPVAPSRGQPWRTRSGARHRVHSPRRCAAPSLLARRPGGSANARQGVSVCNPACARPAHACSPGGRLAACIRRARSIPRRPAAARCAPSRPLPPVAPEPFTTISRRVSSGIAEARTTPVAGFPARVRCSVVGETDHEAWEQNPGNPAQRHARRSSADARIGPKPLRVTRRSLRREGQSSGSGALLKTRLTNFESRAANRARHGSPQLTLTPPRWRSHRAPQPPRRRLRSSPAGPPPSAARKSTMLRTWPAR